MPYIYEVSFDIGTDDVPDLQIGQSIQRLVSYLKVRLPSDRGFMFTDGVYSVDDPDKIRVVVRSWWSDWSDLVRHCESSLVEDKVFEEFEPHVDAAAITRRRYSEFSSGPLSTRQ